MALRNLRRIKSAVVLALLITSFIVLIVNYRTARALQDYVAEEEFNLVHRVGGMDETRDGYEPLTRAYRTTQEYYVDTFDSLLISDRKQNKIGGKTCQERHNFVFIKTMKCATQTMASILRRFGYLRRLNFVLPRKKNIYLGWPYIPEKRDYRPSVKPFNILIEHSVYNKSVMSRLMPSGTAYITIIREPYSQFKSSFHYFNVANITKVKGKDQLSSYISNIQEYERFYKSREGSPIRYCIPDGFSVTQNLMSHCLGMPLGFPSGRKNITTDLTAVYKYITELDADFTLVMIMEYFHESLVLLKRLMCWSMEDIIYRSSNVGNYSYKHSPPKAAHLKVHKEWSGVDYVLYNHFNRTLWRKISEQGANFHKEVATYNLIQSQVSDFCEYMKDREEDLKVAATEFNEPFIVSHDHCLIMDIDLLGFIKTRFDHEEPWEEPEKDDEGPKRGC